MPKGTRGGKGGGATVSVPQRNAEWYERVAKPQADDLAKRIKASKNDRERRYHEEMLDTWAGRISSTMGLSRPQTEQLLNGKLKLAPVPEAPRAPLPKYEAPFKTFVNSYGEATTRYITSGTYERAQKRMLKGVEGWLTGRGRKR